MTVTHQNAKPAAPARTVLVGARGFIGAAVKRRLAELKFPVEVLTSADVNLIEPSAADKLASLLRPEDAVVMLAALTPDKGRDIGTLMKNLAMMQNVCAAIEKTGCAHLIYFSSDAVYDSATAVVSEETPVTAQDLYGAMHLTRELMARSLTKVPVLVLRPTLVYGVDDTHNSYGVNRFRRMAAKDGKISLFGGGEETRDYIHVDDLANLTAECLSHRTVGTLNVATGVSHSFKEVAEIVGKQFDKPIEIATSARANPITHRRYAMDNLKKAFPDFRFRTLEDGAKSVHQQMVKNG